MALPNCETETYAFSPASAAPDDGVRQSAGASSALGEVCPGAQVALTLTLSRPASLSRSSRAFAATSDGLLDLVLGDSDAHRRAAREAGGDERREPREPRAARRRAGPSGQGSLGTMPSERVAEQLKAPPDEAGRLRLPRREGPAALRREGEVAAPARPLVLPGARPRPRRRSRSCRSASHDVEVIVTSTEVEALHLEQNLVKRHRPPFNVRLRDDKSFPYIALTVEEEFPRVMFTRERHRRGVLYFGPYANAKKVRETLDVLNRVFRFRPCEGPKPGRHSGIPCLDYHIDRCHAPCVGYITQGDYAEIIDGVAQFLSGDTEPIQRELERQMREAADEERFEDAARYRNRLFSIQHLAERQAADRRAVGRRRRPRGRARGRPRRRPDLPASRRQDDRPLLVPRRERRGAGRHGGARGVLRRALRRRSVGAAADRRAEARRATSRRSRSC